MKKRTVISVLAACSLVASLLVAAPAPGGGQEKLQESPGGYHGELDFPMSWQRY